MYQDLFISRVPAPDAAAAQARLARFIAYEKTPLVSGGSAWIQNGVCIASDQDNSTAFGMDKVEMEKIRLQWLAGGFNTATALYDPCVSTNSIRSAISAGCSLVFYLGHGTDVLPVS